MAKHKSAAKRARQSLQREARNTALKSRVKRAVRKFREAVGTDAGAAQLKTAEREIQKAASKGVLHKRTASRRVSRLMRAQHKAKTASAQPAS